MPVSSETKKPKQVRVALKKALEASEPIKREAAPVKALKAETQNQPLLELSDSFWENMRKFKPVHKTPLTLRVDDDVLAWFKARGKGYQSEINSVLKAYVEAKKTEEN